MTTVTKLAPSVYLIIPTYDIVAAVLATRLNQPRAVVADGPSIPIRFLRLYEKLQ